MDQPKWVAHAGLRNLTSIYDWLEFNWFLILLKELIILCGQQGIPTEESYYLVHLWFTMITLLQEIRKNTTKNIATIERFPTSI